MKNIACLHVAYRFFFKNTPNKMADYVWLCTRTLLVDDKINREKCI